MIWTSSVISYTNSGFANLQSDVPQSGVDLAAVGRLPISLTPTGIRSPQIQITNVKLTQQRIAQRSERRMSASDDAKGIVAK
ncbi:hypothetical protein [Burkholderia sp. lig30]|uniref:hypothetical protein n=1 Tax=Burkholderia sp. lig30 TaxID=1192124 RepID=UPI00128EA35E|nr:hypothetical protein [Burkholderia sp. lig30]